MICGYVNSIDKALKRLCKSGLFQYEKGRFYEIATLFFRDQTLPILKKSLQRNGEGMDESIIETPRCRPLSGILHRIPAGHAHHPA